MKRRGVYTYASANFLVSHSYREHGFSIANLAQLPHLLEPGHIRKHRQRYKRHAFACRPEQAPTLTLSLVCPVRRVRTTLCLHTLYCTAYTFPASKYSDEISGRTSGKSHQDDLAHGIGKHLFSYPHYRNCSHHPWIYLNRQVHLCSIFRCARQEVHAQAFLLWTCIQYRTTLSKRVDASKGHTGRCPEVDTCPVSSSMLRVSPHSTT